METFLILIFSTGAILLFDYLSKQKKPLSEVSNQSAQVSGFYKDIPLSSIDLYQYHLNRLFDIAGINKDFTDSNLDELIWDKIQVETEKIESETNLKALYFQVMLVQYLWADGIQRIIVNPRAEWVRIVTGLNTQYDGPNSTFYPSPWAIVSQFGKQLGG